jgi:uncharacterized membrane protein
MNLKVLVGLGGVATLGCCAALAGGVDPLIVLVIASKLVWLAGLVTAAKAREWRWGLAILVLGAIPAIVFVWMHFRGPRTARLPISVFRG